MPLHHVQAACHKQIIMYCTVNMKIMPCGEFLQLSFIRRIFDLLKDGIVFNLLWNILYSYTQLYTYCTPSYSVQYIEQLII